MEHVHTVTQDRIGTITMCRSAKMNAFNDAFIAQMIAAFDGLQKSDVRVIILRAETGAEVWSAGRDLASMPTGTHDIEGWETQILALGRTVLEFPAPVIAMVEGDVWGFGCEVAFSCDLIVAVPEVSFAITPAKLGVPYTLSGLQTIIGRLGPNLAKEMLFCAAPFETARLHAQGVINHVICAEEIETHVHRMARRISHLAPLSIAALKRQIAHITRPYPLPSQSLEASERTAIELLGSDDYREGISALEAKRRPEFQGQ